MPSILEPAYEILVSVVTDPGEDREMSQPFIVSVGTEDLHGSIVRKAAVLFQSRALRLWGRTEVSSRGSI